jgi:hypothetical protein
MAGHTAVGDTAHAHLVPHLDISHILAHLCRLGLKDSIGAEVQIYKWIYNYVVHCKDNILKNLKKIFQEMKLRGLSPISYIQVSVRDLYISNRCNDRGNI